MFKFLFPNLNVSCNETAIKYSQFHFQISLLQICRNTLSIGIVFGKKMLEL